MNDLKTFQIKISQQVQSLGLSKLNIQCFSHYLKISAKGLIKPYWILYGITNHKIKTNTLIGDRNVGGLKMSDFEMMNKALKASR